jgi:calcineurin-like phosphoesterase family protein
MNNKVFFTSDHHFYHENVIKYSKRPFENATEMNEAMINNINAVVGENDTLYILGDFVFAKDAKQVIYIRSRIKCKNVHWIKGNHDKYAFNDLVKQHFTSIRDYLEIEVQGQKIVLSHFPHLVWNRAHKGAWMLHGHSHGSLIYPNTLKNKRIADIGVDCWDYFPVSFEQLLDKFKNCEDLAHH